MPWTHRLVGLLTVIAVAAVSGCASTPASPLAPSAPLSEQALASLPTFKGDATPTTFDELVAQALDADVVLIGENHGHPVGLPWAAMLFERVLASADKAALSLEFFERDEQTRVDDYLRGLSDEATFRKRAELTPSGYPDGHRRMLEAAKAKGSPVIASNAPRQIIRYLRGKDYDALRSLTPEQQRLFHIPDSLPEGKYRDDFCALMRGAVESEAGHRGGSSEPLAKLSEDEVQSRLAGRFRAQSLWDWTMGDSVTRALDAGSKPVVQVVGRFHSDFRGGLAYAIEKHRPGTRLLIISVVDEHATSLRDDDRGRADYIVYVGPSPE